MNSCFSSGFWEGTQNNETLWGKQLSDIFINHIDDVISLFQLIYLFRHFRDVCLNQHPLDSYLMLTRIELSAFFFFFPCIWAFPPPCVSWKGRLKCVMFGEETFWLASSSLYSSLDRAAMAALTRCTADRWQLPARHSRPQRQHLPTMSDALGMEISVSVSFTAHLLCCKWMDLPVLVSTHAELRLKFLRFLFSIAAMLLYVAHKLSWVGVMVWFFWGENSVAIRLQHLPSGVFSTGIPSRAWDASICAFTQLNMTFERACTRKKKKKRKPLCAHTQTHSHTSQRLCESHNAEPEGWCVSDVCIVYSVVPVHVGDWCALRPHSSLVLFAMTGVDSRLLSRRPERPSKERGEKRRQKSKETERDHWLYLFSLYICSHTASFSFLVCLWSLFLKPLPPWVTSCQTARGGCRLSSYPLFSHFLPFGIHTILYPGNYWEPQVSEPKPHRC